MNLTTGGLAVLAVALLSGGATSESGGLTAGMGPLVSADVLPTEPRAALLFAAQLAGLDTARIAKLANVSATGADATAAYDALVGALGQSGASASQLPDLMRSPGFALLVDAAAHAVRLQSEAIAALDVAAARTLDAAYREGRAAGDRTALATAWDATGGLPAGLDRERLAASALVLVDAAMRAAPLLRETAPTWPTGLSCIEDGSGLLILCGPGDDTITGDHMLEIDLGGNDRHLGNSGGSGIDLLYPGANGLPAALSLDLAGNDLYEGGDSVQGTGSSTPGVLIDLEGSDTYRSFARFFNFVQGAGHLGGVGLLFDALGDDAYLVPAGRVNGVTAWDSQGFGIFGGLGIHLDAAGNDLRVAGTMGMGVGDFQAVGLLVDTEGSDAALAVRWAQGFGDGGGVGVYADASGNDAAVVDEERGQGVGIGGTGVFFDASGEDWYVAGPQSRGWAAPGPAWKPVNDVLSILGLALPGGGVFVDASGDDAYHGPGCDGCIWSGEDGFGFDLL